MQLARRVRASEEPPCSVDPSAPHPQTPPPCETEFRSTGHSQTGVWERGGGGLLQADYAVRCLMASANRCGQSGLQKNAASLILQSRAISKLAISFEIPSGECLIPHPGQGYFGWSRNHPRVRFILASHLGHDIVSSIFSGENSRTDLVAEKNSLGSDCLMVIGCAGVAKALNFRRRRAAMSPISNEPIELQFGILRSNHAFNAGSSSSFTRSYLQISITSVSLIRSVKIIISDSAWNFSRSSSRRTSRRI
jgi:hypothetical protein